VKVTGKRRWFSFHFAPLPVLAGQLTQSFQPVNRRLQGLITYLLLAPAQKLSHRHPLSISKFGITL